MCIPGYCNGSCGGYGGGNPFHFNFPDPFANFNPGGFAFQQDNNDQQPPPRPNQRQPEIIQYTISDEEPTSIPHKPAAWNSYTDSSTREQLQSHFKVHVKDKDVAKRCADGMFECFAPRYEARLWDAAAYEASSSSSDTGSRPRPQPQPHPQPKPRRSRSPPPQRRRQPGRPTFSNAHWEDHYQYLLSKGTPPDEAARIVRMVMREKNVPTFDKPRWEDAYQNLLSKGGDPAIAEDIIYEEMKRQEADEERTRQSSSKFSESRWEERYQYLLSRGHDPELAEKIIREAMDNHHRTQNATSYSSSSPRPAFSDPRWEDAYQNLVRRGISPLTAAEVIRQEMEEARGSASTGGSFNQFYSMVSDLVSEGLTYEEAETIVRGDLKPERCPPSRNRSRSRDRGRDRRRSPSPPHRAGDYAMYYRLMDSGIRMGNSREETDTIVRKSLREDQCPPRSYGGYGGYGGY